MREQGASAAPMTSIPATRPTAPAATTFSTAHFLLEALNEIGIDYLFCNFGTDHAPIIEEIAAWQVRGWTAPRIVMCPHENIAMHMAAGYALATGRGQAVLVHVDSGTANAALGMHNLFRSRIPGLLIAGSAPFTSFGELEGTRDTYVHFIQQPLDQASLVRPYSKWEYTLPSGVTVKETLRRAHTIMQSDPQGPVYLQLPREILTQRWEADAIRSFPEERFGPVRAGGADPEIIDNLAAQLVKATNPVLVTAYGGRNAGATAAIETLSRIAGITVIDLLTFCNIGRDFPHFGGFSLPSLDSIDFGLLVDIDVPWIPAAVADNPDTFWAHIDVDVLKGASPIWSFPGNLRIQGSSGRILAQLAEAVERCATPAFRSAAAARVDRLIAERQEREHAAAGRAAVRGVKGEINPHYLFAELARLIGPEDIVVNEAVTGQAIPNQQIPRPIAGTMISNAGGGLGASSGMALGMKLAMPERCVVQIVGDGSYYFNTPLAAVSTAKQYDLPTLTIILDNSGWAAVKGATLRVYPEGVARQTSLFQAKLASDMEYSKLAEVTGAYGEKLTDPNEVAPALERCLKRVRHGQSAILHACVTKL
jgi:acetolactate synthase-1/2/3 large subunit